MPVADATLRLLQRFPRTRYQGSKRKLLPVLAGILAPLGRGRALDAFGGTAAVSYLLRVLGHRVTYNDLLAANALGAGALLAPPAATPLWPERLLALASPLPGRCYDDFIAREYAGIYYTDEENRTLDLLAQNLDVLTDPGERGLAWFAIAQACLIKRPYNLFHRANLGLRQASVSRSFGNKASWERPFAELLPRFLREAERALLDGLPPAAVCCGDALDVAGCFDLVYLDPPYLPRQGMAVDYGAFYHFLEGMLSYAEWPRRIERSRKHRPYRAPTSPWNDRSRVVGLLDALCDRHRQAVLVVSYRSDGVPSPEELLALLRRHRPRVAVHDTGGYQYVLSTNRESREMVFVAA